MATDIVIGDEDTQEYTETAYKPSKQGSQQPNLLDSLREELRSEVTIEPIRLNIETRHHLSLRYLPDFEMEKIAHWQRRCTLKGRKDEIDPLRFSKLVLMDSCTGIFWKGQEVPNRDGDTMTLTDNELTEMTGQIDIGSAVSWLFGNDAQIIAHATRVLREAGFDSDGSTLDADENNPLGSK